MARLRSSMAGDALRVGNITVNDSITYLGEIIRRIIEVAQPEKIILFGSAARGEMGPDSDLDFLVVKRGAKHRRRLAQQIYLNLFGITVPVDVVVVTPEDVQAYAGRSIPGCRRNVRKHVRIIGRAIQNRI